MSLIYHLHYYGGYQCTLQVQNTFCYFRWNINIILIWLYNSHLFKCAMRYRSDSQWAGGICFRASCRASKRSSGSVSSDTNKQTNNQVKNSHLSRHICSVIVKQICRQQDFWILYELLYFLFTTFEVCGFLLTPYQNLGQFWSLKL